jgi:hypothetical protein
MWHKSKKLPVFVYLSSPDLLLRSHDSFILEKYSSELCVDNKHYSVRQVAKDRSHKRDHNDQETFGKMHPIMDVCQIKHSWEQYGNYLLDSIYNRQLSVHVKNTRRGNVCLE